MYARLLTMPHWSIEWKIWDAFGPAIVVCILGFALLAYILALLEDD